MPRTWGIDNQRLAEREGTYPPDILTFNKLVFKAFRF
jgi:hypothetical protein